MSDAVNASAGEATATALASDSGSAAPATGFDRLEQFFTNQESSSEQTAEPENQVDNQNTEAEQPEQPEPEQPAETESETPIEPSAQQPEPEAEPEETANFDALTKKSGEFLNAEGLKAKFPRNSSNELIALAAEYSEGAKKGQEILEAIGGEEFVAPVGQITKAIQSGNARELFEGIGGAGGPEALVRSVAEALRLGLVESASMKESDNELQQHVGTAFARVTDLLIAERFGANMTMERLDKLAQLDEAGWLDKIEKWTQDEYVDHSELDELLNTTSDPKLLEATKKLRELEKQLGEKDKTAKESTAKQSAEVENSFTKLAHDQIDNALTGVVWARSPLRDIASDTPEIKEEKAFLREYLSAEAKSAFAAGSNKAKLVDSYKTGKNHTAVFKQDFAGAINEAVLATREKTAIAERVLAKLYGKTRNPQLLTGASSKNGNTAQTLNRDATTGAGARPTETKDFSNGGVKSREEIIKRLEDRIAAM